jgi:hypothetical protein
MKFYHVFSILLFSLLFTGLNAQKFAGGSVGFYTEDNKTLDGSATTQKQSSYNFTLSPFAGKFLSEKKAIGFSLDFSMDRTTSSATTENISGTTSIGGGPFLRYYAIKKEKLSLFGQGNIGIRYSNSNIKKDGVTDFSSKETRLYLYIYPALSYDVTDKLSLQTSINILKFGYYHIFSKQDTIKRHSSNFQAGAGLNNIVNVGAITIGAIYKF